VTLVIVTAAVVVAVVGWVTRAADRVIERHVTEALGPPADPDVGGHMTQTTQTDTRRSLRGGVAALSTVAALAGPALASLRLSSVAVAGDTVAIVAADAGDAKSLAGRLGLGPAADDRLPWVTPHWHTWEGDVGDGLHVIVSGAGRLEDTAR
jgi:hypothetical protein